MPNPSYETALIVGAGRGLSASLARLFARDEKAAERADHDRPLDLGRDQLGDRAASTRARVVDDDVGRAGCRFDSRKQPRYLIWHDGVASKGFGAGLGAQRGELFGVARGERHLHTLNGEKTRKRRAETAAGADDQRGFIGRTGHVRAP